MMLFVYAIPEANTKITILKLYQKQISNNSQYFANIYQNIFIIIFSQILLYPIYCYRPVIF